MRFRRLDDSLQKTLAFAGIHLLNAAAVGWLLTGSFVLAGLLALIEPALNSLAHYRLERLWSRPRWRRCGAVARTLAFGAAHLLVVLSVGWALTGSFVLAGAYALIEPAANTVAHYFFERWWGARRRAVAACGA